MRTRFKPWALPYLDEHREIVLTSIEEDEAFFSFPHLEIEIGCGKGDFIVEKAELFPKTHFLAVEVSAMVAAMATKKIVEKEVTNVRVIVEDIAKILPVCQAQTFDAIYLNFSDPWPKKRHEKRRLTFPTKLLEYIRILKVGGHLYFKSDNSGLYEYSLLAISDSPFQVVSSTSNYKFLEAGDAMTEYEKLFRSEGISIKRIIARRIS
ncbi:MAG: tRNA (guanosine(46)-N7)-methyltransferase TrmB [Erysipelotrichia bacterium]|jgi:tRNA (guanine-N7-)-methyltransferase|nr:tRNA (guanosine(46)-N7)-methyltransferase TrmB [Erysipelotrichia bacterium]